MRNAVLVQAEGAQRTRSALILSGNGCGPRTLVWRGPRAPAASWAAAQLRNRPRGLLASPAQPSTYSWRSRDTGPKSWTILTLPAGRPSQESGAACVLRAHYTHRVTGPHRLPHGARHPRGALSASSSRHGSHLRGWRAPSPRDVPLRPQDQRAARVSREGGDARPAAAPLGPGSGAQRARASPLCPNKGGRHRGTRTPTRRAGPCSEGSRHAIESFMGAYQVPKQRHQAPLLPHAALATGLGRGLKRLWQVGWPQGDRWAFLTERVPGPAPRTES